MNQNVLSHEVMVTIKINSTESARGLCGPSLTFESGMGVMRQDTSDMVSQHIWKLKICDQDR